MANDAHDIESKPLNRSMQAAKASKQDEFYTQLSDIEKELKHYAAHFEGKTVLCNCDDPRVSNFFHY
ncbi:MAG TPA: adenine-specific methyltransferase EcoRI family protein, partial [Candidatus Acidoferrum sp.]|nr:adenine-specific methyltransferase EcoRI family protein [Candidatus Acidoferrum sp.]